MSAGGDGQSFPVQTLKAPKNGYVFVYLSNESKTAVFFDNFDVTHIRGRLVEENAYYAYGLKIKGISARAFSKGSNPYGYQGDFSEGDTETGWDEFDLRMYDAQIGRWTATDPYDEFAGPYIGMGSNPVNLIDPSGGSIFNFFSSAFLNHVADAFVGGIAGAVISGAKNGWSKDAMFKGMGNGALVGLGAGFVNWGDIGSLFSLGWDLGGFFNAKTKGAYDFIYNNGVVSISKSNNNQGDRLLATNGDVIDDDVASGLLKDKIDFRNKVTLFALGKKDLNLKNHLNDLLWRLSFYEQKEISWGWFEAKDEPNSGYMVVNPTKNNQIDKSDPPVGRTFRRDGKEFIIQEDYHSHPGLVSGLGNRYPSDADMATFSTTYKYVNKNIKAFIYSRQGVISYTATGITYGGFTAWKQPWNLNYIRNTLKWKKIF